MEQHLKKYLRLTCTVCKRSAERLVDLTHYTTDKCTITLGCEGRLQPVGYLSAGEIATAPAVGLIDWRPRGTTVLEPSDVKADELVSLETGSLQQLVLASQQAAPTLNLQVELRTEVPKAYRQYVFRREGIFTSISGVESGLEKKTLRFTAFGANPDLVQVYLNGVLQEPGISYSIYSGVDTGVAPNSIVFTAPITQSGVAQVDVVVSKEATANQATLGFTRNTEDDSRANTGAYENISSVDRFVNGTWVRYWLYYLDLAELGIELNTVLTPITQLDSFLLLASKPYTQLDRCSSVLVQLANLDSAKDYVKYALVNGAPSIKATTTTIRSVFPPLRFNRFNAEPPITTASPGEGEQLIMGSPVIVGPDA